MRTMVLLSFSKTHLKKAFGIKVDMDFIGMTNLNIRIGAESLTR